MNIKRSRQDSTQEINQTVAKKIKISTTIPEHLKNVKNVYENDSLVNLFEDVKQIAEIMNEPKFQELDEDQLKDYRKPLSEKICSFLFQEDRDKFPVYFNKLALITSEDINKRQRNGCISDDQKMEHVAYYLVHEYDYEKDTKYDFSLESFLDQVKFGDDELTPVLSNEDTQRIKDTIIELLKSWIQGDMDFLSIVYGDHFPNFIQAYKELEMLQHPTVISFHDKCLLHILKKIASTDKKKASFKHAVSQYHLDRKINQWKQKDYAEKKHQFDKENKQDHEDEEDFRQAYLHPHKDNIQKISNKKVYMIFSEVCQWGGSYPFCGLLDANDTVKGMFEKIDACAQQNLFSII